MRSSVFLVLCVVVAVAESATIVVDTRRTSSSSSAGRARTSSSRSSGGGTTHISSGPRSDDAKNALRMQVMTMMQLAGSGVNSGSLLMGGIQVPWNDTEYVMSNLVMFERDFWPVIYDSDGDEITDPDKFRDYGHAETLTSMRNRAAQFLFQNHANFVSATIERRVTNAREFQVQPHRPVSPVQNWADEQFTIEFVHVYGFTLRSVAAANSNFATPEKTETASTAAIRGRPSMAWTLGAVFLVFCVSRLT